MKTFIIYVMIWTLTLAAAGIIYVAGYFNEITATAFGFILSTLLFAAIGMVLPALLDEHYSKRR